jgi:RNA polymerase sigma factor (sigma-70 family)
VSQFHPTRQTLIAKIRNQHDEGAWDEFVNYYRPYIYTVITRMGLGHDLAEDSVQKVIMTLWKKLPDFEYMPDKCKFRTWMNNVTRKEVLNAFRTAGRYDRRLDKASTMEEWQPNDEMPDIYVIAEDEWKLHVSKLAWENVQNEFSGKAMDCFMLFSQGKNIEEVCEELDLKANSAYVLRSRVSDKLAKEIRRLDQELS